MSAFRLLILMSPVLVACGEVALDASAGGGLVDTRIDVATDVPLPRDSRPPDEDTSLAPDVDGAGPDELPYATKEDPALLVPREVAAKASIAASGDLVAWVERSNDTTALRVWDVSRPTVPPRTFVIPNLVAPRDLALSDAYLAYVDVRFGDPDIFAIALDTGREQVIASGFGAQEHPSVLGSRVAWEDCSACVMGDGPAGREPRREIFERDLTTALPARALTADQVADHSPRYGLLADGRPALAWVSGRATLRLERLEAGLSLTADVVATLAEDAEVGGLALIDGGIAWRPRPRIVNPDSMIVNPDSMWPSDLFLTPPDLATSTALTVHAELGAALELAPDGRDGFVTWLESPPNTPTTGRIMRSSIEGAAPVEIIGRDGLTEFAVGRTFVAFIAPRDDNDGLPDLHVLPTP
jgi:hypothetical protein